MTENLQHLRALLFGVDVTLQRVQISISFPCKLQIMWKRGNQKLESTNQPNLERGIAEFGSEKLQLQSNMYFDDKKKSFLEKQSTLTVFLLTTKGNKVAGTAPFELSQYLNMHKNSLELVLKLEKCPDKNAVLKIKLDLTFIKQIDFDTISQMSTASRTNDDDAPLELLNQSYQQENKPVEHSQGQDLQTLQQELHEKEEQCNTLLTEVQQYRRKSEMLMDQVSRKEEQIEQVRQGYEGQIVLLNQKIKQLEVKEQQYDSLTASIASLEAENNQIKQQSKAFEEQIRTLNQSLQHGQSATQQIQEFNSQILTLKNQLQTQENQSQASENRINELNSREKLVTAEIQQKNQQIEQLQSSLEAIVSQTSQTQQQWDIQFQQLKSSISQKEASNQSLIEQIKSEQQRFDQLQASFHQQEKYNQQLLSETHNLKLRTESLSDQLSIKEQQLEGNKDLTPQLEHQVKNLRQQFDQSEQSIQQLQAEKLTLLQQIEIAKQQLLQKDQEIQGLDQQIKESTKQLSQAQEQITLGLKRQDEQQVKQQEAVLQKLGQAEQRLQALQVELDQEKTISKQTANELQQRATQFKQIEETKAQQLQSIEASNNDLTLEVNRLKQQLEIVQHNGSNQQTNMVAYQNQIKQLTDQIHLAAEANKNYQEELNQNKVKLEQVPKMLVHIKAQQDTIQSKEALLAQRDQQLNQIQLEVKKKFDELTEQIAQQQIQLQNLQKERDQFRVANEQLLQKMKQMVPQEKQEETIGSIQAQLGLREQQYNMIHVENQNLRHKIDGLQEEFSNKEKLYKVELQAIQLKLSQANESINLKIQQFNKESQSMKQSFDAMSEQYKNMESSNLKLQNENNALQQKLETLSVIPVPVPVPTIGLSTASNDEVIRVKDQLKKSQNNEKSLQDQLNRVNDKYQEQLAQTQQLRRQMEDQSQLSQNQQSKLQSDLNSHNVQINHNLSQKQLQSIKQQFQEQTIQYSRVADELIKIKCQVGDLFNAAFDVGGTKLVDELQSAVGILEKT